MIGDQHEAVAYRKLGGQDFEKDPWATMNKLRNPAVGIYKKRCHAFMICLHPDKLA